MAVNDISGKPVNNIYPNGTSYTGTSSVSTDDFAKDLENAVKKNDTQALKKVCREFESIMLNMMYKSMKSSVPKSELIPSDSGRDIFESMMDEKLMEEASAQKGVGLADMLYSQLSKSLKSEGTGTDTDTATDTDTSDDAIDDTIIENKGASDAAEEK